MIRDKATKVIIEALLYCQACKTWTKHVRVGNVMMCGCGTTVEIVRKNDLPKVSQPNHNNL